MPFSKLGLNSNLLKAIEQLNYKETYPIQLLAIPEILNGKDVLGIAPTGSGKTASYVLPILTSLSALSENRNEKNLNHRHPLALILVPTRELAIQVQEVFYQFSQHLEFPLKSLAIYGGVSSNPQMKAMMGVSILVATPGRLLELVDSNAVNLNEIKFLVLDESDKLLNQGFEQEMNNILYLIPKKRQNLLFSATLSHDLTVITQLVLNNPVILKIDKEINEIEYIEQSAFQVTEQRKGPLLRYLIQTREMKQVLVFVSSALKADAVVSKLQKNKINAVSIHGKKTQEERMRVLRNFKEGKTRVLVTTDLLARGIDIVSLPYVINFELPRSPKDFVHRIGRTGRAEQMGEAISLITPDEEHHFKIIQKKMGIRVPYTESDSLGLIGY